MANSVKWLCILLVTLRVSSSTAFQILKDDYDASGDEGLNNVDKGREGGRPPDDNSDDDEVDEDGSGGEVVINAPSLGSEKTDGGDDDIGGGGIVIETADPIDISGPSRKCPNQNHCLNGGSCFQLIETMNFYCQCQQSFKGDRCEFDDLVIKEVVDGMEPKRSPLIDIMTHPAAIAALVAAGLLIVGLVVTLLVCCCLCIRKKDEGSYALDSALKGPGVEYTKVDNSQEFYA